MKPACGASELLRQGGPVRVPLRECCVAALIGVATPTGGCEALTADKIAAGGCGAVEVADSSVGGWEAAAEISAGPERVQPVSTRS